jgi:hypothetical protein
MSFPRWRALRAKLIALQNKAVGTDTYRSQDWDEVRAEAAKIAQEGIGEPDRAGPDDITVKARPPSPLEAAVTTATDPGPPDPEPPEDPEPQAA